MKHCHVKNDRSSRAGASRIARSKRPLLRPVLWGWFSLLWILSTGCSSSPVMSESQNEVVGKLMAVQQCYLQHSLETGRAPASIGDLQPLLTEAGHDSAGILQTSADGSELIVLWGVMPNVQSAEPVVIGYEENAQDGQRVVMTSLGVWLMPDEEFYAATFPDGHQAPARPASSN